MYVSVYGPGRVAWPRVGDRPWMKVICPGLLLLEA